LAPVGPGPAGEIDPEGLGVGESEDPGPAVRAAAGVTGTEAVEQHDLSAAPGQPPRARGAHDPRSDHDRGHPSHPVRLGAVEPSRPKPVTRRRELAMFAVPMVILAIGANIGNALAPTLITQEPVALLALAPRTRWLLLSSPKLDALSFYLVPFVRAFGVL